MASRSVEEITRKFAGLSVEELQEIRTALNIEATKKIILPSTRAVTLDFCSSDNQCLAPHQHHLIKMRFNFSGISDTELLHNREFNGIPMTGYRGSDFRDRMNEFFSSYGMPHCHTYEGEKDSIVFTFTAPRSEINTLGGKLTAGLVAINADIYNAKGAAAAR